MRLDRMVHPSILFGPAHTGLFLIKKHIKYCFIILILWNLWEYSDLIAELGRQSVFVSGEQTDPRLKSLKSNFFVCKWHFRGENFFFHTYLKIILFGEITIRQCIFFSNFITLTKCCQGKCYHLNNQRIRCIYCIY